jgi:hypothetical protein
MYERIKKNHELESNRCDTHRWATLGIVMYLIYLSCSFGENSDEAGTLAGRESGHGLCKKKSFATACGVMQSPERRSFNG